MAVAVGQLAAEGPVAPRTGNRRPASRHRRRRQVRHQRSPEPPVRGPATTSRSQDQARPTTLRSPIDVLAPGAHAATTDEVVAHADGHHPRRPGSPLSASSGPTSSPARS